MKRKHWDCNHDRTDDNTSRDGRCATCLTAYAYAYRYRHPFPTRAERNRLATGETPDYRPLTMAHWTAENHQNG